MTIKSQDEKPKTYIDIAAIYEGDTIAVVQLRPVHVFAPLKFKNNKERQAYWADIHEKLLALKVGLNNPKN